MKRLSLGIIATLLVACGDPLVTPEFLGTPRLSLQGGITQDRGGQLQIDGALRLSLFWIGANSRGDQPLVEQGSVVDTELTRFSMSLYDAPPEGALTFGDLTGDQVDIGFALLVLYSDENDNGALDVGGDYGVGDDRVIGASENHVLGFLENAVPEDTLLSSLMTGLQPGYHLFESSAASTCLFVEAVNCAGEGTLTAVDETSAVILSLHPDQDQVVVPAPLVPSNQTVRPTLYGPR